MRPVPLTRRSFAEFGRRHDIDVYLQRGGPGTIVPLGSAPRTLDYSLPQFGITLRFAPTDFVQVNAPVNAQMVAAAVELAAIEPGDRVLDLYCGLGNFSLPFAQRAAAVLGVEGEAGLVARAVRNAALNGLGNARFLTADLAKSDWSFFREHWDIVVLDPPRTGADVAIAEMRHVAPRRIVYVSCHPATLARDARVLVQDLGYRLTVGARSRHVPAYPPCRSDGTLRTVRSRPGGRPAEDDVLLIGGKGETRVGAAHGRVVMIRGWGRRSSVSFWSGTTRGATASCGGSRCARGISRGARARRFG